MNKCVVVTTALTGEHGALLVTYLWPSDAHGNSANGALLLLCITNKKGQQERAVKELVSGSEMEVH